MKKSYLSKLTTGENSSFVWLMQIPLYFVKSCWNQEVLPWEEGPNSSECINNKRSHTNSPWKQALVYSHLHGFDGNVPGTNHTPLAHLKGENSIVITGGVKNFTCVCKLALILHCTTIKESTVPPPNGHHLCKASGSIYEPKWNTWQSACTQHLWMCSNILSLACICSKNYTHVSMENPPHLQVE